MKKTLIAAALSLVVGAGASTSALADTISVGASSDDWGDPAIALSGNPSDGFLRVFGMTNNAGFPIRRGAMEFSLAGITPGATIVSASLFFADRGTTVDSQMQLHGYAADGLVQVGDLNDAAFLSFFNTDDNNQNQNFNIDVTAFIQSLVDAAAGFTGFMLRATNEGPGNFNGADIASREFNDANARPLLTVEFTTVPEPSSALLLALGLSGLALRRRRAH